MSWKLKYDFQYYPLWAANPNIVQIWHNTDSDVVYEAITGHKSPFVLELPEIKHKFQVVRGKGCTVNLLSESDMKFFNSLYHVDPQEFMVKHYRGDKNGDPDFFGYLNAEMMTEPYDFDRNYQVTFTCNDGFSLMDRFSFVQSDGTNYTGIKSKFEILQIIFAKIALPYDQYRIALSTTFADFSGAADSTILHESYVDCSNFYNEDPAPMSLREVVESILAPYGAFITAQDGHIYITDINTIAAGGNITYKQFGLTSGNYVGTVIVNNEKSISNIGYMGTGQSIEKSGGVNKQVVTYSPYPVKTILEKSIVDLGEFETVPSSWATRGGFHYKYLLNNSYWELLNSAACMFEATYGDIDNPDIHFSLVRQNSNHAKLELKKKPTVNISGATTSSPSLNGRLGYSSGVGFLISGNILVKTKNNPYNSEESGKYAKEVSICIMLKVGDRYYNSLSREWQTDFCTSFLRISNSEEDSFVSFSRLITLGNINENIVFHGDFTFQIWSDIKAMLDKRTADETLNPSVIQEIWLGGISVGLVNLDGSEISDKDIQHIGLLDKTFKDEGEEIKLHCGTDAQFSDRGKIMKYNVDHFESISKWTRSGQTFKIEELLLNSLSSNYRAGFISLLGMKLQNKFDLMNVLTDTFIGSKKLMIKSASVNYEDNTVECSLVEISPDSLTIVPSEVVGAN